MVREEPRKGSGMVWEKAQKEPKAQKWSGEPKRLETVGEKQAKKWLEKGSGGGLSPATVLEGGPGCTSNFLVGNWVARATVLERRWSSKRLRNEAQESSEMVGKSRKKAQKWSGRSPKG